MSGSALRCFDLFTVPVIGYTQTNYRDFSLAHDSVTFKLHGLIAKQIVERQGGGGGGGGGTKARRRRRGKGEGEGGVFCL
jgi:hypothetical protein